MPATAALGERELRRQHFAVLSTAARDGSPHAAGVTYGVVREASGLVLYVMTRRHLRKAQDILWFVPPRNDAATRHLGDPATLLQISRRMERGAGRVTLPGS